MVTIINPETHYRPSGGGRLPAEYQEVEYVESTGAQYINTNVTPTTDIRIEMEFMYLGAGTSNSWLGLAGSRDISSSSAKRFAFWQHRTSSVISPNYSTFDPGTNSKIKPVQTGVKYTLATQGGNFYLDSVLKDSTTAVVTAFNKPIFIFDANSGGSRANRKTKMRVYSFKLFDGSSPIRDMVPCYRKSDSEIGLYDLVEDLFYKDAANASDKFIKGGDV